MAETGEARKAGRERPGDQESAGDETAQGRARASAVPTPHDRFFLAAFSNPAVLNDFLATYLSPAIRQQLDLGTASVESGTVIDPHLDIGHSDLLVSIRFRDGSDALIYVLAEHKSYVERLATLQILGYLVKLWARDRAGRRPLRPIIPLVIYHGARPWNAPTNFKALFPGPAAVEQHWPAYEVTVLDLSTMPEETIAGDAPLRAAMLTLQAIWHLDVLKRLAAILELLRDAAESPSVAELLVAVLRYVGSTAKGATRPEFERTVRTVFADAGDGTMTVPADGWIAEGLERGRKEGLNEGLHQAIELAVQQRFADAPQGEVAALLADLRIATDADTLRTVLRAIVAGEALDGVRLLVV